MLAFEHKGQRFNYRAGGVAVQEGRVLLCYAPQGDFWYLPGGRVEMGEEAQQTLRREVWEELGLEAKVGRLLWVNENFFELEGQRFHELGLYFELELPLEPSPQTLLGREGAEELLFGWFAVHQLPQVLPSFVAAALVELGQNSPLPKHLVQRDI